MWLANPDPLCCPQVKSTEGLFPKMNQLYLFTSEMENFTKVR